MKRVDARSIFVRTGRWPRRQLRRMKGGVEVGGGWIALDDEVSLDASWLRLRLGSCLVEARAVLPPIVLLDKPLGVVTSRVGEGGARTVFEELASDLRDAVEPVGRLDRESTGLLLLVGDGRLIQHLGHPKREVPRTYLVTLAGEPDADALQALREGRLELKDGHRPRPLALERLAERRWSVTLTEGKYHEVRRMFAAAGTRVMELRRTAFAGFTLDDLKGAAPFRRLDEDEVAAAYDRMGVAPPSVLVEVREVAPASPKG